MASTLKVFYQNAFHHLKTTGSIAPSSRFLAQAMIKHVKHQGKPLCILEAGPGTGPFTKRIAALIDEQDHLDLCELNEQFVEYLKQMIQENPKLNRHKTQIEIHHKPVQELTGENRYDYIISGLPFNNFEPEQVREILDKYKRLLKPEGTLSFFEYAGIRPLKPFLTHGREKARVKAVDSILREFLGQYEKERIWVPWNLPPSIVHICRFQ
ncbi:MAG: methyltransferase domain-containing protein [Candidatus Omnitrophica bacterium]|nr:methyltransferase domain-containing protein [Candidatus Omnitrophota bacterium]